MPGNANTREIDDVEISNFRESAQKTPLGAICY